MFYVRRNLIKIHYKREMCILMLMTCLSSGLNSMGINHDNRWFLMVEDMALDTALDRPSHEHLP